MNSIKELFNTVAVVLANLLDLNPTGWKASKQQAIDMAAAKAKSKQVRTDLEVLNADGTFEAFVAAPSLSPLQFLLNRTVNAGVSLSFIYLGYVMLQVFSSAIAAVILVALLAAAIQKTISWAGLDKATRAAPTAA